MSMTVYYPGGFRPAALAQNKAEQWDDATLTYTSWDLNGTITLTRAYAADEIATMRAQQAAATAATNSAALRTRATNALASNMAFLALVPTFPLTAAEQQQLVSQVQTLTQECTALIRLALGLLDSTN